MLYKFRDTTPINTDPVTVTGEIVTVDTSDEITDLVGVTASLEPIQDLHGYDKPWSGGAEKNLFDEQYPNIDGSMRRVYVHTGTGTFTLSTTAQIVDGSANLFFQAGQATSGESTGENGVYSGRPRTVTSSDGYVTISYRLVNGTTDAGNPTKCKTQLESGSSATTYEPYSNICPISGHTECVTSVVGKNLLDESLIEYGSYGADGAKIVNGDSKYRRFVTTLLAGEYTFSTDLTNCFIVRGLANDSVIVPSQLGQSVSFTLTEESVVKFAFRNSSTTTITESFHTQIEVGTTATEYEPYNGNTYTTSLGRTVYGGTLDVVSGVLTDKWLMLNLGALNWSYDSPTQSFWADAPQNGAKMDYSTEPRSLTSQYSYYSGTIANMPQSDYVYSMGNRNLTTNAKRIFIRDSHYTSASDFKTAMNGVQLVYELSTPQTYQLTPQEVELLLGTNNLWTDCGEISVTTKKTLDRVWLPSEAVSINGQYLENVVDGYRTLYTKGRESLEVELDTYSVGTADGETYKSKRYPARTIKVGFQLIAPDNWEFRRRFNQLNNLLSLDEADFIFNDETDKFFAGIPRFNCEVDAGENSVKGEWEIYCVYPFKRTVNPVTLTMADADVTNTSATFTIDYKGGQPARPVLRAKFAGAKSGGDSSEDGDCGFVAFMDADENIIQLGNPDVIDRDQYTSAVTLINKEFVNTTGWTGSATVRNITDTYWQRGKGQTQSYASMGNISKTTEGAVNLKVSLVHRLCINNAGQIGTFGVRCKDANNNAVCGFQIRKTGNGTTARVEYLAGGNVIGADNIDISYYNTHFGYCNRSPVYVKETYQVPTTQTTKVMVKVGKKKKKKKYKTVSKTVWVKKVRTVQKGWNYTQSNLNSMFTKTGDSITFKIGNLPARTYKAPSVSESVATTIELFATGNFHTNAVHSVCFRREAGTPFAEKPNVFTAGDVVEADCNDATVQLYRDGSVGGSLEPQYGALGNDWESFKLHNGYNVIRAVWSDWVNPTYKPSIEIEYNEVFI